MGGTESPGLTAPPSTKPPLGGADTDAAAIGGKATLDGNQLLSHLSPDSRRAMVTLCRWRRLDVDDVVFDQDDPSQDVYFIVEGRLRIVVYRSPEDARVQTGAGDTPRAGSPAGVDPGAAPMPAEDDRGDGVAVEPLVDEGTPMTLVEMGGGDTFGELSAIDGRMRSARAVALEPTILAVLDGPTFMSLVQQHPALSIALLRRVAGYLRNSNQRMYNLSTLTAKQRVYMQLMRLAEVNPDRPMEWIISPLPAHTDIAFWSGTKRETVAAAIGWLAREGVVMRQNRALIIRQPSRLKALAHV
ncbi:Crp/Fnr family transcriptional regulator [Roseospira visakhapatnamensis]|uniref:CRP-like cAMP-binding protein n=1 Tax=Roseospira visakhapatnamensis TaxID=390880 RepID=A0A7W6WBH3_9PROT|nr:Crp/Fnr family transcriptional regulator [Roseospira visakhapatnamensis]MBB4268039.1 CRP-like cAMP-binding protein [Roseospira visakhapatnamensis]